MELRPTTDGDLPALHAVFLDAIGSVFLPHGFQPAGAVARDVLEPSGAHPAHRDIRSSRRTDGTVVGYGSSWARGDDWFLASLFVAPAAHGRGVGPALLDAVWSEAKRRRTMTDAIQPISNVLYGGRGLVPATPVLTFYGRPQIDAIWPSQAPPTWRAIDELAYGFDREVDHRHWSRHARRTDWRDAYSYVFPGGEIGPVAGSDTGCGGRGARG